MRISRKIFSAVVALSACADSQAGMGGNLRFGQVLQYAETQDFTASIAAGQEMPVAIQGTTRPALLNDYPYLDGTLTASRKTDGQSVTVQKTDTGKFKATFPSAGTYVLHATTTKGVEDSLEVEVAQQSQLRLARVQRKVITSASSKSCSTVVPDGASLPDLKSNQTLLASIVPADASGNPLLGKLDLEFTEAGLHATATLGTSANSYTFGPTSGTTGPAKVTVKDRVTGQTFELNVNVTADSATCPTM
jgi:hypothetical protein